MALEIFRLFGSVFVNTDDADKSLQKSDKNAESLGKRFLSVVQSAGKFAAGVVGSCTAVGAAIVGLTESTREYRTEQGKLVTAFTDNEFAAKNAKDTYTDLVGILGDTGQAVEATNHLAKLCDTTEGLSAWTKICTGVYATFGASLPIEGLTEAANETAKVGQVTGPLADALNWAGVSEDAFNESLAACTSEQERQVLITNTLNGLYSTAADKYREVNAEVIAANVANDKLASAMAEVGGEFEPIVTQGKTLIAEVLTKAIPYVELLASVWIPAFIAMITNCCTWIGENTEKIVEWTGYILAAGTAVGTFLVYLNWGQIMATAAGALELVTKSIQAMTSTIKKNPIGMIISLISSLIVWLTYLYNTNEEFRVKVDETASFLWAKLKLVFAWLQENAFPAIEKFLAWAQEYLPPMIAMIVELLENKLLPTLKVIAERLESKLLPAIQIMIAWIQANVIPAIHKIAAWILDKLLPVVLDVIDRIHQAIAAFFSWFLGLFESTADSTGGIWEKIKGFFGSAWDFIVSIWNACAPYFEDIWNRILVPLWGLYKEMIGAFQMAWDAIKLVWDYVEPYFRVLCEKIKGAFETAWQLIMAIWSNAIAYFTMVWAGIKAVFAVVKGILSGDFSDAWEAIKNLWDKAVSYFKTIWDNITKIFESTGRWFGNVFRAAWNEIKKAFSEWGEFFGNLWKQIQDKFSAIGTHISNAISKSVKAGLNGVISSIEGIINTGVNMINGAINLINQIPGVSIGSLSKLSLPRLYQGAVLEKGQVGLLEGNGAEAVVPLHNNQKWISAVARDMDNALGGSSDNLENVEQFLVVIISKLEEMLAALLSNQNRSMSKREFARLVKEVG